MECQVSFHISPIMNDLVFRGSGYFIVKTAMPLPFAAKNMPHGSKAKRKLRQTTQRKGTKSLKATERGNKSFWPFGASRSERSAT